MESEFKVLDNKKGRIQEKNIYQYTLATFKAIKIGQSRTILPAVKKSIKIHFWRFSGWWRIVSQTFDKDEIFKEVGLRSKKRVNVLTWVVFRLGNGLGGLTLVPLSREDSGEKQEKIEGADDETTDDEEEEIISNS